MGALAGLARLKSRASTARKTLALQLPPKVAGDDQGQEFGGRDLSVATCRTQEVVLQSWHDKVFPGEGKGFESPRDRTFTGTCHSVKFMVVFFAVFFCSCAIALLLLLLLDAFSTEHKGVFQLKLPDFACSVFKLAICLFGYALLPSQVKRSCSRQSGCLLPSFAFAFN